MTHVSFYKIYTGLYITGALFLISCAVCRPVQICWKYDHIVICFYSRNHSFLENKNHQATDSTQVDSAQRLPCYADMAEKAVASEDDDESISDFVLIGLDV